MVRRDLNMFNGEDPGIPDAWELMQPRINAARRERMIEIAAARTAYIRLCLQDVHDPHNIGACLRSAEANGIQYCDYVNIYQKFAKISSTSGRGAHHWLDHSRFTDLGVYVRGLRERGYKIAAAYPPKGATHELDALPIDQPLVLAFGNEHQGLAAEWDEHVDYRFTIPMHGMTESYNVSVSAAIALYSLTQRCRREVPPERFLLPAEEQAALLNRWMRFHSRRLEVELEMLRARRYNNLT